MTHTPRLVRFALLLGGLSLLGAGCLRVGPGKGPALTVWGVFDDAETMRPLIAAFQKSSKKTRVSVEYKKISPADLYEEKLRTALAEGRGPDVFLLHVSWFSRWAQAVLPAPTTLVPVRAVQEEFVDTVTIDLVKDERVLGLPLFLDSLALYYNKDLFNRAGIALPPRTWAEAHDAVKRTTKFNPLDAGQIDQHGITLGSGRNVNRAPDVLSALMLQNGASMVGKNGEVAFGSDPRAVEALRFLTDFANPSKDVYTWQTVSDYSLDAFAEGEAAMMVNYSYHRPTIRAKNPRLNFGVAPLPQVNAGAGDQLTYAGYWAFAVSKQTTNPEAAWAFIRSITAADQARGYLKASGYPPSRRDLVAELRNDKDIGVFADQALIARTWPQPDNRVVDRVFTEILDDVVTGRDAVEAALRRAAEQIQAAATALRGSEAGAESRGRSP
jgi:multiple sugar transport system substrate-binding protein